MKSSYLKTALIVILLLSNAYSSPRHTRNEKFKVKKEKIRNLTATMNRPVSSNESARIYRSKKGYLDFIGAPKGGSFTVDKKATPKETADEFLSKNMGFLSMKTVISNSTQSK
jgi:hypothetical protein